MKENRKTKTKHTTGTVPTYDRKIVEPQIKSIPLTYLKKTKLK